jgi:hypothetical protein
MAPLMFTVPQPLVGEGGGPIGHYRERGGGPGHDGQACRLVGDRRRGVYRARQNRLGATRHAVVFICPELGNSRTRNSSSYYLGLERNRCQECRK